MGRIKLVKVIKLCWKYLIFSSLNNVQSFCQVTRVDKFTNKTLEIQIYALVYKGVCCTPARRIYIPQEYYKVTISCT